MFNRESLESLLSLLQEMTAVAHDPAATREDRWMHKLEIVVLSLYATLMAIMAFIATTRSIWSLPIAAKLVLWCYWVAVIAGLVYVLAAVLYLGRTIRLDRKLGAALVFARLKREVEDDANFLLRLHSYDKKLLEYVQLQYRYHWSRSEGRLSMLVGDFRRLGLLPALVASAMATATLLHNGINWLFWTPLILAAIFYVIAFLFQKKQERPRQVLELLDYAIRHAGDEAATDVKLKPRVRRVQRKNRLE